MKHLPSPVILGFISWQNLADLKNRGLGQRVFAN